MLLLQERATPATPAAGWSIIYPKADGQWYFKDDAGVEQPLAGNNIPQTLIDAKGDLIVGTAADTAGRLAVGANGTVLTADSAEATGTKWANVSNVSYPLWYIAGLTYSNNVTDATNDVDIAAGVARSSDDTENLILASAITKRLDAAWAVGTNAGGLDTGVIGNSDYYIHLIKRIDTGVVDVLFSLQSSAPTLPANYTKSRRIGWFRRLAGIIILFKIYEISGGGYELTWITNIKDIDTITATANRTARALSVMPSSIAVFSLYWNSGQVGVTTHYCLLTTADQGDVAASGNNSSISSTASNTGATTTIIVPEVSMKTNSSSQVFDRGDTAGSIKYFTRGYVDARRT